MRWTATKAVLAASDTATLTDLDVKLTKCLADMNVRPRCFSDVVAGASETVWCSLPLPRVQACACIERVESVSLWPRSASLLLTRTPPLLRVLLARRHVQPSAIEFCIMSGSWERDLVATAGGDFLCCTVECPTMHGAVMSSLSQVALQITIADSQLDGPSRWVGAGRQCLMNTAMSSDVAQVCQKSLCASLHFVCTVC